MSKYYSNRCGFCYESGHNVRKCPQKAIELKRWFEHAKARRDKMLSNCGNSSGWSNQMRSYGKQYALNTGLDPETEKPISPESPYYTAKKTRKCSYCLEPGHTRRTCTAFAEDKATIIHITKKARRQFVEIIAPRCGIGSLEMIKVWESDPNSGDWVSKSHPHIAVAYSWKETQLVHSYNAVAMFVFRSFSSSRARKSTRYVNALDLRLFGEDSPEGHIRGSVINTVVPDGWLEIESEYCDLKKALEDEFPKGARQPYSYSQSRHDRYAAGNEFRVGSHTYELHIARRELGFGK